MFWVVEPSTSRFSLSHGRLGTSNNTTKDFKHQKSEKRPLVVSFFVSPIGCPWMFHKESIFLRLFLHYPILGPPIRGAHVEKALHMVVGFDANPHIYSCKNKRFEIIIQFRTDLDWFHVDYVDSLKKMNTIEHHQINWSHPERPRCQRWPKCSISVKSAVASTDGSTGGSRLGRVLGDGWSMVKFLWF